MPPRHVRSIFEPLIPAPGHSRLYSTNMLAFGWQLRDNWVHEFPYMAEATYIFQQMASGREFKVSGPPRGAARCMEWLNNAKTVQYDGLVSYGFDDFQRRRALDWLTIGRTLLYAPLEGDLEYLDPVVTMFDYQTRKWYSTLTGEQYDEKDVFFSHAIPLGNSGAFMAPLAPVVPTAMLAWLVREHDKASVDGRKIRDVIMVQGQDLAERVVQAVSDMVKIYTEPNAAEHRIPVVHYEMAGNTNISAKDIVGRIGLSEIPEGFNRNEFEFGYVNEIAGATGLSLRHFWNSERATNRALEEVQEARQQQKGPSYYVRTDERLFNNGKIIQRFGRRTRLSFVEEVDVQSREANARVLKMYAESVGLINNLAPGLINIEALIGFMQRDDILPADIELINKNVSQSSVIKKSDPQNTPGENTEQISSDPGPSMQKSIDDDELDYGEITIDRNFRVLERRNRIYSVEKALINEYRNDVGFLEKAREESEVLTTETFLSKAHRHNLETFMNANESSRNAVLAEQPPEVQERLSKITPSSKLSDDDHRALAAVVIGLLSATDE